MHAVLIMVPCLSGDPVLNAYYRRIVHKDDIAVNIFYVAGLFPLFFMYCINNLAF